jgi:hypothetical protein
MTLCLEIEWLSPRRSSRPAVGEHREISPTSRIEKNPTEGHVLTGLICSRLLSWSLRKSVLVPTLTATEEKVQIEKKNGSFVCASSSLLHPGTPLTLHHRALGTALEWPEAKKKASQVRQWGIEVGLESNGLD